MAVLPRFSTPARLAEPSEAGADAWSARVQGIFAPWVHRFPQFYDPTATDTPDDAVAAQVVWSAFPATLASQATSEEQRWTLADASRSVQDEYCEWSVERDSDGNITRVTFTTEVREYWDHLLHPDQDRLVGLYRDLVSPEVQLDDLLIQDAYASANKWNDSTTGRLAHLIQQSNNLDAAVTLAAQATVLREDDDGPVTDKQVLVVCSALGEPLRNSDPQIAAAVNNIAASGDEITLQDPVGLYIHGLLTAGMTTPDGEDAAAFWTIERGDPEHALRAHYEVPADRGYTVGDVEIDGRPIRFGAQLADRVQVRLMAVIRPAHHHPRRHPCVG